MKTLIDENFSRYYRNSNNYHTNIIKILFCFNNPPVGIVIPKTVPSDTDPR